MSGDTSRSGTGWLLTWTTLWFDAAELQSSRIMETADFPVEAEFLLYVDALRNTFRGAETILGSQHAAVVGFRESVPGAVNVRDMLEHFDEYTRGAGKLQRAGAVDADWLVFFSRDAGTGERGIRVANLGIKLPSAQQALAKLVGEAIRA